MINENVVSLILNLKTLSNTKTEKVRDGLQTADNGSVKLVKKIIESEVLNEITALDLEIKKTIEQKFACPCELFKKGVYLIPISNIQNLIDFLEQKFDERKLLIEKFKSEIEVKEIKTPIDYSEFAQEYFIVDFSIPENLPQNILQNEKEKFANYFFEIKKQIIINLRSEFLDLVNEIFWRLKDSQLPGTERKIILRVNMFWKLKDFIENYPARKLIDDEILEQGIKEAQKILKIVEQIGIAGLKNSPENQAKIIEILQAIKENVL